MILWGRIRYWSDGRPRPFGRSPADGARRIAAGARAFLSKIKKRPKLFSLGRLGSPPPELPNHNWILWRVQSGVNVTLVIAFF
jgi:hypothetical protein